MRLHYKQFVFLLFLLVCLPPLAFVVPVLHMKLDSEGGYQQLGVVLGDLDGVTRETGPQVVYGQEHVIEVQGGLGILE